MDSFWPEYRIRDLKNYRRKYILLTQATSRREEVMSKRCVLVHALCLLQAASPQHVLLCPTGLYF